MALFELWDHYLESRRAERLADEVAERSHDQVWDRCHQRAVTMRFAEAQGYVRARAAAVIETQVASALRIAAPLDQDLQLQLAERAMQAVVDSVIHELLKSPQRFAARRMAA